MAKVSPVDSDPVEDQYDINGSPGQFVARFTSPYNTLHQISGVQSRDEAIAWIVETRHLIRSYS